MTCCPGATGLDLRLASFFLRAIRCRLAQSSHLVWPGIEGEVQPTQSPAAFALSRLSCAWRRWYSLRSGRWARFRSYSRRSCCGASGSLGWGGDRFLGGTPGFGGTGFLPRAFLCLWPSPGFPWKRKGVLKCNSFRTLCGVVTMNSGSTAKVQIDATNLVYRPGSE